MDDIRDFVKTSVINLDCDGLILILFLVLIGNQRSSLYGGLSDKFDPERIIGAG